MNVCAGHNMDPARFVPLLREDPRARISPSCERAVEVLRERHGVEDASPFSYMSGLSPFLNVYCEPPQYLTEAERQVFEPVAFFGSLPPLEEIGSAVPRNRGDNELRVYASFGTVVWRYWAAEALAALTAIADTVADMDDARALISLGGADVDPGSLTRPNVSVEPYVDQWDALGDADVFVTHQGMSSTHEAIWSGVPMISRPFFADQPALAAKCRDLGLAVPMGESPRRALEEVCANRDSMRAALARAREWEVDVISQRETVVDRILGLS